MAAAAIARLGSANSPLSGAAPPPPPKTANELEQRWKTLRRSPRALLAYLRQIDGAELCALFRTPADMDLVAGLLRGLAAALCAADADAADAATWGWLANLLAGLARSAGFASTLAAMLGNAERADARALLDGAAAGAGPSAGADLDEARKVFLPADKK
jgi:hypothetical protein